MTFPSMEISTCIWLSLGKKKVKSDMPFQVTQKVWEHVHLQVPPSPRKYTPKIFINNIVGEQEVLEMSNCH